LSHSEGGPDKSCARFEEPNWQPGVAPIPPWPDACGPRGSILTPRATILTPPEQSLWCVLVAWLMFGDFSSCCCAFGVFFIFF
jgi:hypothetical protein